MRRLICFFLGHVPYLDYSQGEWPEPNVYVGPVMRYCGRCFTILPGTEAQVGDRRVLEPE